MAKDTLATQVPAIVQNVVLYKPITYIYIVHYVQGFDPFERSNFTAVTCVLIAFLGNLDGGNEMKSLKNSLRTWIWKVYVNLKKKNSDKKVGNISYINDWINDYKLHMCIWENLFDFKTQIYRKT